MRGEQLVAQHERLKIHQYFTVVKLYTLLKYDEVYMGHCQTNNIMVYCCKIVMYFLIFYAEKPSTLLSFSNVNKGRKKNKCTDLKNKRYFAASKAVTDMVIKNLTENQTQVA
jgi:hypothetical protein